MLGLLLPLADARAVVNREDIILRDPYIYTDSSTNTYYMYGTVTYDGGLGFDVYSTTDPTLRTWSDPQAAFRRPGGFWGMSEFWAPEVFENNGSYYLFGTARGNATPHGMFVLKSNSPAGPFAPYSSFSTPITDPIYHSIDGTLYFDDLNDPWMVYTSERSTDPNNILHDMRAIRLLPDLSDTIPATDTKLFDATAFPQVANFGNPAPGNSFLIVDGPELYRSKDGSLLMAWSSFTEVNGVGRSDYAVTIARSSNGQLDGTWVQESEPLFASHGGHGMIFEDFEGQLRLGVHQPNSGGPSPTVPSFIPIYDVGNSVTFTEPNQPVSTVGYFRFEEGAPTREFVDGVDIIDVSGAGNHLRTYSDDTAGVFQDSVSSPTINQSGRRNLLSYDNSPAPGGTASTRDLFVASGPLNSADYAEWTIEASINLSQQIPGHANTFVGRDGSGYGIDGKLAAFYFQVQPNNKLSVTFVDQELDVNGLQSNFTIATGQWYNVAAVSDGTMLSLYVDSNDGNGYALAGQLPLIGSNNALVDNNRVWTVGRGFFDDGITDQFFGLVDEVRFSNQALNPGNFLFAVPIADDFDNDGDVDGNDLQRWESNFGTTSGATTAIGDADGDDDVDGNDFLTWQQNFGQVAVGGVSSLQALPEPSSCFLLLFGVTLCGMSLSSQCQR